MTDLVFCEMFIKEPYEKGYKDGAEETKIENAINLLKDGFPIEAITKSLKLTQEDLKKVKAAK